MRRIDVERAEEWIDLPKGGRLQFRIPTWEEHDRAINRAADRAEGGHDGADVTRELAIACLVAQDGFGKKDGEVTLPADAPAIVASLHILDVRAIESVLFRQIDAAGSDLGN